MIFEGVSKNTIRYSTTRSEHRGATLTTMKLIRTILISAAAIANAYVPAHMELPDTFTDVSSTTVRVVRAA